MTDASARPERRHVEERGYEAPASPLFAESQVAFLMAQRVGRLATAAADGTPQAVPVCFAFDPPTATFYIALDAKPKRVDVRRLKRVRNILENPRVVLLCDVYREDWARLAWCAVHAEAGLLEPDAAEHAQALALLREKYPQYRTMPLEANPVIVLRATSVTSWTGADARRQTPDARRQTPDDGPQTLDDGTRNTEHGTRNTPDADLRAGLDFFALARGRRSVRTYAATPVPRAVVERVLEAARWAPSPHGRQPWRFVVLTAPAAKQALAEAMAAAWRSNLAMDRQSAEVVDIRLNKSYQRLLAAPVLIIPCLYEGDLDRYPDPDRQVAERIMAIQSAGAAAQNLLLAAYSLGLDAGWMCAPLFCPDDVRAALGLAPDLWPQAILTLGYATGTPRRRARLPLSDLIIRYE